MKLKFKKIRSLSILIVALFFSQIIFAQDGATLFKTCSACHSIGGGRMVGPDLKGVSKRRTNDWLIKYIQSSKQMVASGDADANAIFEEYKMVPMPDNALTSDQINQILSFIDGGNAGGSALTPEQLAMQKRVDSLLKANSAQDIIYGIDLFTGNLRFTNGGPSCISCHNATFYNLSPGGILAKDLTKAYTRLGGFAGLKGIIAMPPFPAMTAAYKNKPITEEEIAYLQLFLRSSDIQNPVLAPAQKVVFLYSGIGFTFLIVIGILAIWFKRKRKSVNHAILKRQERYSL